MNKELVIKLIERARSFSENAYCPYTNVPVGCAIMTDDNIIFGGCNIENGVLGASLDAGEVAIAKAISEGHTRFLAICFWCGGKIPYPSGKVRQIISEFSNDINMIFANDETYSWQKISDIFPLPPEVHVD
ncbi:MAG: cytidine deaminase [Firmicutes bacterium]|nr:cytidine deaminase [Bacillota bacterium]